MTETLVLAGDIGATNARLALYAVARSGAELLLRETWARTEASAAFGGLAALVAAAVAASGMRPAAASFGVAGPVRDGRSRTTNLPWEIEAASVASVLGLRGVGLLNDLEAAAWGLETLPCEAFATLHAGALSARGTQALLSVGTGLGEAFIAGDGSRRVIGASEGGHASFAPRDEEQDDLLGFLRARHGHVSWERVLSGPGLVSLAEFLLERGDLRSDALASRLARGEGARAVTDAAQGGDPLALHGVDLFARLCAAELGNLALKVLATGGVFLAGGIPPRIRPWLESPRFVEAFLDKGRMRPVLDAMPVRLVLDESLALRGAAKHAAESVVGPR